MTYSEMPNKNKHQFLAYTVKPYRFLLREECPQRDAVIAGITADAIPGKILKSSRRRNVFILEKTVVKKYVFRNLSDILKSQRYGNYEFACYQRYLDVFGDCPGVRIPQLYGYFNAPLGVFFSSANGIVIEYIADVRYLRIDELPLTSGLFAHLFRKGIYHPDMQIENILYDEEQKTIFPIDLIGCNFLPEENPESLIIMLARLAFTAQASKEQALNLLLATLRLLPRFEHSVEQTCRCFERLLQMEVPITTHQRKKMVFLPRELRKILHS